MMMSSTDDVDHSAANFRLNAAVVDPVGAFLVRSTYEHALGAAGDGVAQLLRVSRCINA